VSSTRKPSKFWPPANRKEWLDCAKEAERDTEARREEEEEEEQEEEEAPAKEGVA
jgi:hypothetical protein